MPVAEGAVGGDEQLATYQRAQNALAEVVRLGAYSIVDELAVIEKWLNGQIKRRNDELAAKRQQTLIVRAMARELFECDLAEDNDAIWEETTEMVRQHYLNLAKKMIARGWKRVVEQ